MSLTRTPWDSPPRTAPATTSDDSDSVSGLTEYSSARRLSFSSDSCAPPPVNEPHSRASHSTSSSSIGNAGDRGKMSFVTELSNRSADDGTVERNAKLEDGGREQGWWWHLRGQENTEKKRVIWKKEKSERVGNPGIKTKAVGKRPRWKVVVNGRRRTLGSGNDEDSDDSDGFVSRRFSTGMISITMSGDGDADGGRDRNGHMNDIGIMGGHLVRDYVEGERNLDHEDDVGSCVTSTGSSAYCKLGIDAEGEEWRKDKVQSRSSEAAARRVSWLGLARGGDGFECSGGSGASKKNKKVVKKAKEKKKEREANCTVEGAFGTVEEDDGDMRSRGSIAVLKRLIKRRRKSSIDPLKSLQVMSHKTSKVNIESGDVEDENWDMGIRAMLEEAKGIRSFAIILTEARRALDTMNSGVELDRAVLKEVALFTRSIVYQRDPEDELPQLMSTESFSTVMASSRVSSLLEGWSLGRKLSTSTMSSDKRKKSEAPAKKFTSSFGFGLTLAGMTTIMSQLSTSITMRRKPKLKGSDRRLAATLAIKLPDIGAQARVELEEPSERLKNVRTIISIRRINALPLRRARKAAFLDLCRMLESKFASWHNNYSTVHSWILQ